jgi:uncharacterized protein (TIGR03663 family)
VGTVSTKSRKTNQGAGRDKAAAFAAPVPEARERVEISNRTWLIASAAILLVAAVLRFYNLDLVPLHHDEGVNGNFLVRLVREGYYHYDPANYHGPTLYYFAAIFPWLLRPLSGPNGQYNYGLTTVAIRCVPALCGLATVALVFTLRRNLGTIATLGAAFLLAISPGAVYLSRYFIHETLFVFFTLGIVVSAVKYYGDPNPIYLVLGATSAGLLFATKETAVISVAVLAIALVLTLAWRKLWLRPISAGPGLLERQLVYQWRKAKKKKQASVVGDDTRNFLERAGGPTNLAIGLAVGVGIFVAVNVLFYSSFFTNSQGVYDSLKTFQFWTKTGKEAHVHPFITYVWWLLLQESPLLILGAMGALLAVVRPAKSFGLFCALWAFGLMAAYSLIAYKTPWLSLNFIVPLALTSGVTIEWIYDELAQRGLSGRVRAAALAGILLIFLGPLPGLVRAFEQTNPRAGLSSVKLADVHKKTFLPGYQTIDLNFLNYDNDNRYYVYVYAHTRRETLKLVDEINRLAARTHQGAETGITIVSPDYWPLPWYLRDYKRVGYHGRISPSTEPIIIARQDQAAEVQATFGDRYQQVMSGYNPSGNFPLRPGVDLLLYVRRELR